METEHAKMEKPPVRKANRALNLVKPAPRKSGVVKGIDLEGTSIAKTVITPEKNDKENRTVGKRASRGLKLEKPAPLKSSKINKSQDENMSSGDNAPAQLKEDVVEGQTMISGEGDSSKTYRQADMNANLLIKEALADLEVTQENSKPPTFMQRQTRLLSQVSDDSGLGDMSSCYSRQGSMLESLSENQDDLDWGDIDDSAVTTFSFGKEHLKCLSTTVNQIQPFNSLLANDDIQGENLNRVPNHKVKDFRRRNFSAHSKSNANMKQTISRSYSVPSNISNRKEVEFWDDELDVCINGTTREETEKRHPQQDISLTERIQSLRAQNGMVDLEKDATRRRHSTCSGDHFNGDNISVIPNKGNQLSTPNVFRNSTRSISEDWESEVIDVEPCTYEEAVTERPYTPVNVENPSDNETYSAINNTGNDPESTPKAGSVLSKFSDCNSSVKLRFGNAELVGNCENGSTELPGKSDQSVNARVLENCDITSAMMKNMPSYQNYREKRDADLGSSTTDTDDRLSSCISENSFDEQMYAWELIDDLSDRVNSLKLDQENSDKETCDVQKEIKETYDIQDEIPPRFVAFPEDLDAIEAELEFMREDLDLSESLKSDKLKYVNSVLKMAKSGQVAEAVVKVIREPLSPFSPEDEIWRAEEGMQTGFCTAKGRRGMFRYYRQCQVNDNESESSELILLQYSGKELLKLGTSMLSKRKPDSWPYLEKIYPSICLKEVSSYFDCEKYAQERDYVVEVYNVQGDGYSRRNSSNSGPKRNNSGFPDVTKPPPPSVIRGGFGIPKGGFGTPSKPFTNETAHQDVHEKNFIQSQRSSTPVEGFEKESEANGLPVSNEKQTETSYMECVDFENIEVQNDKVNLDSKCDVSVRNEGSFRLFEAATNKILPIKPAREFGVKRSISDPEGDRLSCGRDFISDERHEMNKPAAPDYRRCYSYRGHQGNDSDLVLNKDLPEVCPW